MPINQHPSCSKESDQFQQSQRQSQATGHLHQHAAWSGANHQHCGRTLNSSHGGRNHEQPLFRVSRIGLAKLTVLGRVAAFRCPPDHRCAAVHGPPGRKRPARLFRSHFQTPLGTALASSRRALPASAGRAIASLTANGLPGSSTSKRGPPQAPEQAPSPRRVQFSLPLIQPAGPQ